MGKKKNKPHSDKNPKGKHKQATGNHNMNHGFKVVVGHAFSSGWVQNSTVAFAGTVVLLVTAMATKTQIRAAAIGVGCMGTIALWVLVVVVMRNADVATPTIVHFGGLTPGNEASAALPAGTPNNTVQLMLGDDLRVLSASLTPVLQRNGKPFLTIGVRDGVMWITATINDKSDQYICRIIDNEFQINEQRSFNPRQPDSHSLLVRDADGNEVLNIRFLNPRAIWITGRFKIPGDPNSLIIDRTNGIVFPGGGGIAHLTLDMTQTKAGVIGF